MPFLLRFAVHLRRLFALLAWGYASLRVKGWIPFIFITLAAVYFASKVHESRTKNIAGLVTLVGLLVFIGLSSLSTRRPIPLSEAAITWVAKCENQKASNLIQYIANKYSVHYDDFNCEEIWHYLNGKQRLYLQNGHINDISLLTAFTNLQVLDLSNNDISSLTGLDKLVNLRTLNLADNPISSIEQLPAELIDLNLSKTIIQDIRFLQPLTKLRSLDLSSTQVTDLSILTQHLQMKNLLLDKTPLMVLSKEDFPVKCPIGDFTIGYLCKQHYKRLFE